MKGVSAVIAVILILMIVVALAALAYTWFQSIATDLMESTGESVSDTAEQMQMQFSLQAASCSGGNLEFTIRNTGTGAIDGTLTTAFLDGSNVGALTATTGGDIAEGATETYTVAASGCAADQVLRVSIESGLTQSVTL